MVLCGGKYGVLRGQVAPTGKSRSSEQKSLQVLTEAEKKNKGMKIEHMCIYVLQAHRQNIYYETEVVLEEQWEKEAHGLVFMAGPLNDVSSVSEAVVKNGGYYLNCSLIFDFSLEVLPYEKRTNLFHCENMREMQPEENQIVTRSAPGELKFVRIF